jgi:hypothetical protein
MNVDKGGDKKWRGNIVLSIEMKVKHLIRDKGIKISLSVTKSAVEI